MPQMSPLNWLNLFMYTILVFCFLNSINYFFKNNKISEKSKIVSNKKSWKW